MVDPWIVSKAYADGWMPPIYTKNSNKLIDALQDIDFILITHIHEDHFDKDFLSLYAGKNTKIIFPRVYGWKYFETLSKKIGIQEQLHIIDFKEKLTFGNLEIQAIQSVNTDSVNTSDKIAEYSLSIDAGFIVSEKSASRVAFMADNNPYNHEELKKAFKEVGKVNLFCISHSGFASDYPFNYGYSKEECINKYKRLETNRQEKQLKNIKSIVKPDAILAYSSSFLPNKWADENWWHCAEISSYFTPEAAALKFEKETSIKSFGLDKDLFLDVIDMKIHPVCEDKYFNNFQYLIHNSIENPESAANHTLSNLMESKSGNVDEDKVLLEAFSNFHQKADSFSLEPTYEIQIQTEKGVNSILNRPSNIAKHKLKIAMEHKIFLQIITGKLHWDSAMLSYHLNYQRTPDIYCQHTYNALLNFFKRI